MTKNRIFQLYHPLYVPNTAPNTNLLLTKSKLTLKEKRLAMAKDLHALSESIQTGHQPEGKLSELTAGPSLGTVGES